MGELIVFYVLAALITACSVVVVTAKNPVTAAVYLVLNLFLLAGIYALQGADFIAAIQVIVYAGAIVVLFMFVIMLLNLHPSALGSGKYPAPEYLIMFVTVIAFAVIGVKLVASGPTGAEAIEAVSMHQGNTHAVGLRLFTGYLWPFELASILILLAVIASVVIAKKKPERKDKGALHGAS